MNKKNNNIDCDCPFKKFKNRINNRNLLLFLIFESIIAAMYVSLTLPFGDLSFKELQFRLSEVLLFLVIFDRKHIIGIALGTFIANIFSPMIQFDLTLGVLATVLAGISMGLTNKYYFVSFIFPAIFNALLIPIGLYYVFEVPYLMGALYVGLSEIILMYLLALPIYLILRKTELKNLLKFEILKK